MVVFFDGNGNGDGDVVVNPRVRRWVIDRVIRLRVDAMTHNMPPECGALGTPRTERYLRRNRSGSSLVKVHVAVAVNATITTTSSYASSRNG